MSTMPGLLISFEGIDGAGKTTLLHSVAAWLKQQHYTVIITKEPGGTRIGKLLKQVLLEEQKECDTRVELLLFAADRAEHFSHLVIPALESGAIILSDRMADSAVAYQGFGRQLDVTLIQEINTFATRGIVPDHTFYVDAPYDLALHRRRMRNQNSSSIEDQTDAAFWHRVRSGYEYLLTTRPTITALDGKESPAKLFSLAQEKLIPLLAQKPEIAREANLSLSDQHRSA